MLKVWVQLREEFIFLYFWKLYHLVQTFLGTIFRHHEPIFLSIVLQCDGSWKGVIPFC